ncbi:glycosyltransferase family A protein [Limnohabitans sp. Jir72]|uniref:glycosyltransferase family A protein n=1 Tax=Limnohabitans sp. Jir72 TaxID=1977909 RepID=UPI000D37A998|nr:glycosyltransferase family A protein [Limnohabitans sp. Jir72]PUE24593.1 hypothetical protein B9Z52_17045 [Limnohabitans sp. Jir72]
MKKIAVITPYYKEPTDMLRQTHESVLCQQGAEIDHFMIADGYANLEVSKWKTKHIVLPQSHGDNGNTPRGIGSLLADVEGYDFIAYLDADNWFHANHLESLLELHNETNADICTSFRTFHSLNGEQLNVYEENEDNLLHVDTSCLLIHRKAFCLSTIWMQMPRQVSPICDRIFVSAIHFNKFTMKSTLKRTVAFRSQYEHHYTEEMHLMPTGLKTDTTLKPSFDYLLSVNGVNACTTKMGFWPPTYMPT